MLRFWILLLALSAASAVAQSAQVPDPFAALRSDDGDWTVTVSDPGPGHIDHLRNRCSSFDRFYACQQTVNGKVVALVVFIADTPSHFFVNNILPNGEATGRTDLTITGSHWVYLSQVMDHGNTTLYRTINDFADSKHIHFASQSSTDGKLWTTTFAGDEVHP